MKNALLSVAIVLGLVSAANACDHAQSLVGSYCPACDAQNVVANVTASYAAPAQNLRVIERVIVPQSVTYQATQAVIEAQPVAPVTPAPDYGCAANVVSGYSANVYSAPVLGLNSGYNYQSNVQAVRFARVHRQQNVRLNAVVANGYGYAGAQNVIVANPHRATASLSLNVQARAPRRGPVRKLLGRILGR